MILLLSSLGKAKACATTLEEVSHEPVEVSSSLREAIEKLQAHSYSAVIFDQLLLDSALDEDETIFKHLGSAVPIYVNFAIAGIGRVVREFRFALHRRAREMETAKKDAAQALRRELSDSVTALLLSCEMALKIPELPQQAERKMQDVELLAREVSAKLETA
jgi:hypothetical protein